MSDRVPPNAEFPPPKAGEPLLHRAARLGDIEAIERLVHEGHDINAEYDIGLDPGATDWPATPLMVAAGSGDGASVETVQRLLDLGADPKAKTVAGSAAMFACSGLGWNYRPGGDPARLPSPPGHIARPLTTAAREVVAASDSSQVRPSVSKLGRAFDLMGQRAEVHRSIPIRPLSPHSEPFA